MPDLFVKPTRNERVGIGGGLYLPFDQYQAVVGALLGMVDHAEAGLVEGTNNAAHRVRREIVDDVEKTITLDRSHIEAAVHVDALAEEGSPSARVRVEYIPEPLIGFTHGVDSSGLFAIQRRGGSPDYVPAAFLGAMPSGHEGIFQRKTRGGKRVGRLPIEEKRGESVKSVVENTPGFLDRTHRRARWALVGEIGRVRDEIVNERGSTVFSQLVGPTISSFVETPLAILGRIVQR